MKTMDETAPLLSVWHLCKRYGDSIALSDVSFDVRPGEILGVIGPNGAGKTTLLECVTGLLPADAGEFAWNTERTHRSLHRDLMFYLPDHVSPYSEQYTYHVIKFFADMFDAAGSKLFQVIEQLELQPALKRRVGALSKGYQRRLLLAISMLVKQQLLLLDEPFDGLDLRQTRQAMSLLRELKQGARSLVLSIHQLSDAEKICDRFLLLSGGTVRGCGSLSELKQKAGLSDQPLEEVFLALT